MVHGTCSVQAHQSQLVGPRRKPSAIRGIAAGRHNQGAPGLPGQPSGSPYHVAAGTTKQAGNGKRAATLPAQREGRNGREWQTTAFHKSMSPMQSGSLRVKKRKALLAERGRTENKRSLHCGKKSDSSHQKGESLAERNVAHAVAHRDVGCRVSTSSDKVTRLFTEWQPRFDRRRHQTIDVDAVCCPA